FPSRPGARFAALPPVARHFAARDRFVSHNRRVAVGGSLMLRHRSLAPPVLVVLLALAGSLPAEDKDKAKLKQPAETPTELPRIPDPDPKACELPPGFTASVVTSGLTYPTSI